MTTVERWLDEAVATLVRLDELLAPGDIETFMAHDRIVKEWLAHRTSLYLALGVAAAGAPVASQARASKATETSCALPAGLHLVKVQGDGAVAWVQTEDDLDLSAEQVALDVLAPALEQLRQLRGKVRAEAPTS